MRGLHDIGAEALCPALVLAFRLPKSTVQVLLDGREALKELTSSTNRSQRRLSRAAGHRLHHGRSAHVAHTETQGQQLFVATPEAHGIPKGLGKARESPDQDLREPRMLGEKRQLQTHLEVVAALVASRLETPFRSQGA